MKKKVATVILGNGGFLADIVKVMKMTPKG